MKDSKKDSQRPTSGRWGIGVLFGMLVVWATIIAWGTLWRPAGFEQGNAMDVRRSLFVIGTMGAFLWVWWIALRSRNND